MVGGFRDKSSILTQMNPKKQILSEVIIIGGGFGGLNAATGLKNTPVKVNLIDKQNYHLFQPLLYQLATAVLAPNNIASPIRTVLRSQKNASVILAEVDGVDLQRKVVYGPRAEKHYDYLVLAMGVEQSYFGHDEFRPNAPGLKSLDDAIEIQRRILMAFEEAEYEADEASRQGKLTFVVVGGGPTGVELTGAVKETATQTLPREFRNIDTRTARVILVEGGDQLLGGMPGAMGERAQHDLEGMGVEVRLNSYVTSVDAEGVKIGDDRVPAENVLWAAGVQGTQIAKTLGVDLDHLGRVKVQPDLSVPGYPEVFVVGDAAHIVDPNTDQPVPGVAQGAIQGGQFVADIIRHDLQGIDSKERPAFHYFDKGSMATISRGKAVASIKGKTIGGFLGWLSWGLVHIMFLVGFRTKVVVMLDWIWNYFSHERGARIITGDPKISVKKVFGARMYDEDYEKR